MEAITTGSQGENSTPNTSPTPLNPEPPVRILVQTLTHLIPGKDGFAREDFILNVMCQHHWGCDFSGPAFRWGSYDAHFAFNNRRCFFLVDYGKSDNDDEVPILPYEWTGESLKPLPSLLKNEKIQSTLKKHAPFTPPPREKREPMPRRDFIKLALYEDVSPRRQDMDYVREHPEDLVWLKAKLRPRFWRKLVAEMNRFKPVDAPDIEE